MSGREVREYTNLTDPKDRKSGKGKDKIDDEDITFQRMVSKGFWLFLLAVEMNRCKRLLEIVVVISMVEAVTTFSYSYILFPVLSCWHDYASSAVLLFLKL
ncbi:hypothetical protein QQ045_025924 [Rhodiola kirilowii]